MNADRAWRQWEAELGPTLGSYADKAAVVWSLGDRGGVGEAAEAEYMEAQMRRGRWAAGAGQGVEEEEGVNFAAVAAGRGVGVELCGGPRLRGWPATAGHGNRGRKDEDDEGVAEEEGRHEAEDGGDGGGGGGAGRRGGRTGVRRRKEGRRKSSKLSKRRAVKAAEEGPRGKRRR